MRHDGSRSKNSPSAKLFEMLEPRTLMSAYTPAQIAHAYGVDQISFINSKGQSVKGDGSGQTIAIVDAYDDPNVASDLKAFDAANGLPDTDASGSFVLTKATPQGTPASDSGWGLEISLDVEWAHAMAPKAHILLVEAASSSLSNLLSAVNYGRKASGVSTVSMSWGSNEFSGETSYDSYFTTPSRHPGVTFVASSGDSGAGVEWPASSSNVVAVGGTSLTLNADNTYNSESAWSGSGGGISAYESKPSYQSSVTLSSTQRTVPDVAYNADPNTGYGVYDTLGYGGWVQVGGTSAGAPQWAAIVAIVDQGRSLGGKASLDGPSQTLPALYTLNGADFHDITGGSNGYSATAGYDLVTGRGTPLANSVVPDMVAYGSISTSGGGGGGGKKAATLSSPADALNEPSSLPDASLTAGSLLVRVAGANQTDSVLGSLNDASDSTDDADLRIGQHHHRLHTLKLPPAASAAAASAVALHTA